MKSISVPVAVFFLIAISSTFIAREVAAIVLLSPDEPNCISPTEFSGTVDSNDDLKEIFAYDTSNPLGIRKAFRSLTVTEREDFFAAFNELRKSTGQSSFFSTAYDEIAASHGVSGDVEARLSMARGKTLCMCIHSDKSQQGGEEIPLKEATPLFLPWHRAYIYSFELSLRLALKNLGNSAWKTFRLPYWDWSASSETERISEARAICDMIINGSALTDNSQLNIKLGRYSTLCESRAKSLASIAGLSMVPNPITSSKAASFQEFDEALFGTWHAAVHRGVGGSMSSTNLAANDPLFWLHHANIDRLWMSWNKDYSGGEKYHPEFKEVWKAQRIAFPISLGKQFVGYIPALNELQVSGENSALHYTYDSLDFSLMGPFSGIGSDISLNKSETIPNCGERNEGCRKQGLLPREIWGNLANTYVSDDGTDFVLDLSLEQSTKLYNFLQDTTWECSPRSMYFGIRLDDSEIFTLTQNHGANLLAIELFVAVSSQTIRGPIFVTHDDYLGTLNLFDTSSPIRSGRPPTDARWQFFGIGKTQVKSKLSNDVFSVPLSDQRLHFFIKPVFREGTPPERFGRLRVSELGFAAEPAVACNNLIGIAH